MAEVEEVFCGHAAQLLHCEKYDAGAGMVDSWSAGRLRGACRQLSSLRGSEELNS